MSRGPVQTRDRAAISAARDACSQVLDVGLLGRDRAGGLAQPGELLSGGVGPGATPHALAGLGAESALVARSGLTVLTARLTAKGGEDDRVRGLEDGADDVLTSPFGLAECLARCRALVRRHQLGSESSPALRCGRVSMLVAEHRVCRDGAEVSLSPREFRLLHFFLKHPRRIWSRDELLARVWGESEAVELDPKTVDVHIRWLRLKLEENPAQPSLITTVRGQGYRCG